MPTSCESSAIRIDRLRPDSGAAVDSLLRIYREAIPLSERKSDAVMRGMLASPDYEFLTASLDGATRGFTVVKCFAQADACLLEYMAVDRSLRGQGIGGELFRAASGSEATASRYFLVEVDSDTRQVADREIRARRKAFYRALGCREVQALAYLMPLETGEAPPDMNLMVFRKTLPAALDKPLLRQWLECLYVEVYQKRCDDPRIANMLAALPERISLQ